MLLTRIEFRKILFEALLFEVKLGQITANPSYPLISLYKKDIERIRNRGKYLGLLDRCLNTYVSSDTSPFKEHDYIAYGEIIFCILMHEKYSGSDRIPREFKDPQKIKDHEVLIRIIEDTDAKFFDANTALYTSLTTKDKESSTTYREMKEEEREQAQEEEAYPDLNISVEDPTGLKPGLVIHAIIDGEDGRRWAIYRPYEVSGAQAIGIKMWCTVYSRAWLTYVENGKTLYYVALYDPNRQYVPHAYSESSCRNDPNVYENNLSIGYSGNRLVIPSSSGGASVWGNQAGVTYETMDERLGEQTRRDILAYIDGHFKAVGPAVDPKKAKTTLSSQDQEKRRQEVKEIRAPARTVQVYKQDRDRITDNDDRVAFVFNILRSPHLAYPVLEFIINRSFPIIRDSKLRQSEFYKAGVLQNAIMGLIQNAHLRLGTQNADAINKLRDWALDNPELNSKGFADVIHPLVKSMDEENKLVPPVRGMDLYHFVNTNLFGNPKSHSSYNSYGTFLQGFATYKNLTDAQGKKLEDMLDIDNLDLELSNNSGPGEQLKLLIKNLEGAIKLKTPGVIDAINAAFEGGKYDKFIEENWPAIITRNFNVSGLNQTKIRAVIRDYVFTYIIHPGNTSPFKLALFEEYIKDKDAKQTELAVEFDASREGRMMDVFKEEVYSTLSEETKAALQEWKILWYKTSQNTEMRNNARLLRFAYPEITKNYLDMAVRRHDLAQQIKEMLAAEGVDPKIVLRGGDGHEYIRNIMEFAANQEEFETVLKQGIASEKRSDRVYQLFLSVVARGSAGMFDYRPVDDRSYAVDRANQIKSGIKLVSQKCEQIRNNPNDPLWERDRYGVYSNREDGIPKGDLYKLCWEADNFTNLANSKFFKEIAKLIRFELLLDREFFSEFMYKVFLGTSGGGPTGTKRTMLKAREVRDGVAGAIFDAYVYEHPAVYDEDGSKAIALADELGQLAIAARDRSVATSKEMAAREGIDTSDVNFLQQRDYADGIFIGRRGFSAMLRDFPDGLNPKMAKEIREEQERRRQRN